MGLHNKVRNRRSLTGFAAWALLVGIYGKKTIRVRETQRGSEDLLVSIVSKPFEQTLPELVDV